MKLGSHNDYLLNARSRNLIPQFTFTACTMSDWEIALRNVFKDIYPDIHIRLLVWFYTAKHPTQILGFVPSFNTNEDLSTFVRHLMVIPFPLKYLNSTYSLLDPPIALAPSPKYNLDKLKGYLLKDSSSRLARRFIYLRCEDNCKQWRQELSDWSSSDLESFDYLQQNNYGYWSQVCRIVKWNRSRKRPNVIKDEFRRKLEITC